MAKALPKLNWKEWLTPRPQLPRDKWKATNRYQTGILDAPKKDRDWESYPCCGGTGYKYVPVGFHGKRKRMTRCECQDG